MTNLRVPAPHESDCFPTESGSRWCVRPIHRKDSTMTLALISQPHTTSSPHDLFPTRRSRTPAPRPTPPARPRHSGHRRPHRRRASRLHRPLSAPTPRNRPADRSHPRRRPPHDRPRRSPRPQHVRRSPISLPSDARKGHRHRHREHHPRQHPTDHPPHPSPPRAANAPPTPRAATTNHLTRTGPVFTRTRDRPTQRPIRVFASPYSPLARPERWPQREPGRGPRRAAWRE